MNHLILIDGHNLLFRMFYGMQEEITGADGKPVQAAFGFIGTVWRILRELSPTHLLVLFDSEECGNRRRLDPSYKANRPDYSLMPEEECPFTQLPYIYSSLREMGIAFHEVHGWEVDDVIASCALTYTGTKGIHISIFSTDKDYYQLLSDNVWVLRYDRGSFGNVTPDMVFSKFRVPPAQFADYKCLIGDKSDNLPGAVGIGPKYAAELLAQFGTLDAIIEHRAELPRPSHRKSIEEAKERLLTNRTLMRLGKDAPLPFEALDQVMVPVIRQRSQTAVLRDAGVL